MGGGVSLRWRGGICARVTTRKMKLFDKANLWGGHAFTHDFACRPVVHGVWGRGRQVKFAVMWGRSCAGRARAAGAHAHAHRVDLNAITRFDRALLGGGPYRSVDAAAPSATAQVCEKANRSKCSRGGDYSRHPRPWPGGATLLNLCEVLVLGHRPQTPARAIPARVLKQRTYFELREGHRSPDPVALPPFFSWSKSGCVWIAGNLTYLTH